jgi:hypothetical protein
LRQVLISAPALGADSEEPTILDDSGQYLRARGAEAMCDHVWIFEARTLSTQPVRRRVAETRTHAADETLRTAALVRGLVRWRALLEILEQLNALAAAGDASDRVIPSHSPEKDRKSVV